MDHFKVRLDCVDNYQATPTKFDPVLRSNVSPSQLHKEPKVPVVRVFGATETGQKVCAHIHGAFPYLYIEYTGSLDADDVGAFIYRLHLSVDYALAASYRRNVADGKAKFVARITLVKGIPFYGFHVGYSYYLKIYMLDPMVMTRLADLLRQGAIMKQVIQPYEAHIQYLLQWMTDYNLYGCGYIDCRKATFRSPLPQYEEMSNSFHRWHDHSIPPQLVTDESELPRASHCSIEVDICVQDILNRREIKQRHLHYDFIERVSPIPADEKLVHSMAELWRDETRRRKSKMSNASPGDSPFPPEDMISMSADSRNSQPGGWIHEEEYREKLMSLIMDERNSGDGVGISFDTFVKQTADGSTVTTCLDSAEDLYPENLRQALGLAPGTAMNISYDSNDKEGKIVDEERIVDFHSDIDEDDSPYGSDEDIMQEVEFAQRKQEDLVEKRHLQSPDLLKSEHDIDDESRPGGDQYAVQFLDPSDPTSLDSMLSSQEGVLLKEKQKKDTKRSLYPELGETPSVKRRRSSSSHHLSTSSHRESISSGINPKLSSAGIVNKGNSGAPIPHPTKNEVLRRSSRSKSIQTIVSGLNANPITMPLSQETSKSNQGFSTQSLRFPVVKDPQDPSTILRLSQKSSSQHNPADKTRVSFHTFGSLSEEATKLTTPRTPNTNTNSLDPSYKHSSGSGNLLVTFGALQKGDFLVYPQLPPSQDSIASTMEEFGLPPVIYQDPFYSNEQDVPERVWEWAGREFKLESLSVPFLPEFDPTGSCDANFGVKNAKLPDRIKEEERYQSKRRTCSYKSWAIADPPPTFEEVERWALEQETTDLSDESKHISLPRQASSARDKGKSCQIDGPTQKNKHGFKYTQPQKSTSIKHEAQGMSIMSLEIHVNTRNNLSPNPEEDEVQCLFWCLQSDDESVENNGNAEGTHVGIVVVSEDGAKSTSIANQTAVEVRAESSELDLIVRMVEIVRTHDPDVLTGYEVHGSSWGYLIERARLKYEYNLCDEFSRMKVQSHGRFGKESDMWGFKHTSSIRVTGRHMINIWRAMRGELNLLQYTMENVVFHVLHRRIPHYPWADLTALYTNGRYRDLAKVIDYYTTRVQLDLEILEQNELMARTSEQARLLGVDFYSVFSRGSQFKVESLMFRIAKAENFMLVSPSRKQVGGQNALECLPLVMEPQSAFYTSPVLVLDFQSLYPSVMIAYNYCYSTFLGRVVNWRGMNKMGFTEYTREQRLLELLKDHINIAPNGMMYTKPEIRKSLLAKMLSEILETRVMVKSGMKADKDDKALQRVLNNRQLALKLIANVTYGYTSASFSGRMPCSEIADSIVQTGRETLEKAIAVIHSVERWGAEVVYGDTDSLFIHLKGRTRDQAFDIGEEIAKTITNMNPRPVKLKFEKVYLPCVLLAKKRYVGFKYESRNQVEPDFDAKGIETVRRDGTPAEQKIEETALKILFRTADLSQVKSYFQKQCEKIMKGSISIQDFCFAKEVKLGKYSERRPPPPGAMISTKRMLEDARAEPHYGERVPYVVITGAPGSRLVDRCVPPEELLENDHLELDADYYISKNLIPPLERIFNVAGANVRNWYDEMPKYQRVRRVDANPQLHGASSKELGVINNKKTLESYMKASSCLVCRDKLESNPSSPICPRCLGDKPRSILALRTRLNSAEREFLDVDKVCQSCSRLSPLDDVRCDSKDCPVFYTRVRQRTRLRMERSVVEPAIEDLEKLGLEW
ncbi:DNA polymerase [Venustampulla echinocandica]|uniref:DNA polymerase n=1 Tax=Venustampulla echinocandica TaxID=2656787 RepID=A0A370TKK3_9HELO|nr:DNA polymerase [Venustampulla echinocandica]RDL36039.1 DNA polymerase [Venustampulla echinocandica]